MYIGSFNADKPIRTDMNPSGEELFQKEQSDLLQDLFEIPQRSCDRKVACCRLLQCCRQQKHHVHLPLAANSNMCWFLADLLRGECVVSLVFQVAWVCIAPSTVNCIGPVLYLSCIFALCGRPSCATQSTLQSAHIRPQLPFSQTTQAPLASVLSSCGSLTFERCTRASAQNRQKFGNTKRKNTGKRKYYLT